MQSVAVFQQNPTLSANRCERYTVLHVSIRWSSFGALLILAFYLSQAYGQWQAPLSTLEINTVEAATQQQWNIIASQEPQPRSLPNQHSLGLEIVLIELKEFKSATAQKRIAQVFLFDYRTGLSSLQERDAESGELLQTKAIAQPFLPLTENEIAFAKTLLYSNAPLQQALQAEYRRHHNRPLLSTTELQMKVAVWQPLTNNSPLSEACSRNRCAIVSIFTKDNFSLSTEPVINLMDSTLYLGHFASQ